MNKFDRKSLPPVDGGTGDLGRAAEHLCRFRRLSWRQALGGLVSPALRLHRYREVHNRLLLDALCERDCGDRS